MAQYCNAFKMETDENKFGFAQNPDSFESWQGRRGPYYTPVVSADGTLSWVNNGGLPNPQPVNIAGPPGQGLEIQGVVETVQQLPTGAAQGDVWLVGTASPYEAYIWLSGGWLDLGQVAVGPAGPQGADGVSPEVTVTDIAGGHRVTITDAGGTQTFDVFDGEDGQPGSPGAAGVSPDVTVTAITGGHRVTITDAGGTQTFDVLDGEDGQPGSPGAAGPGVASGGAAGQVLAKASATDYDTEWVDPPGLDLLWTNASPASQFAAQTIAVDLSSYSAAEIHFRGSTSTAGQGNDRVGFALKGYTGALYNYTGINSSAIMSVVQREFTIAAAGVHFSDAMAKQFTATTPATASNTNLIPYQIFGRR